MLAEDNPGLILTRVSGWGQTGPYRERPGFGTVAETASGFAFVNGWPDKPPTSPPFGFADSIAGISAAMGTAMALYQRERTGRGEVIDVALYEPLMFIVGDMILKYTSLGEIQGRVGNGTGSASPRGIYQAADGAWLSIAASNEVIARRLFQAMGQPELSDDPRFATNPARMANNDAIQHEVSSWVAARPRAEILKILDEFEVVSAAVNDARDIVADPHFRDRTLVELTGSEVLGSVLMPGPVLHLASAAGPRYDGVPEIGEHTRTVLTELLSLTPAELDGLSGRGIIGPCMTASTVLVSQPDTRARHRIRLSACVPADHPRHHEAQEPHHAAAPRVRDRRPLGSPQDAARNIAYWRARAADGAAGLDAVRGRVRNRIVPGFEPHGYGAETTGNYRSPLFVERVAEFAAAMHAEGRWSPRS